MYKKIYRNMRFITMFTLIISTAFTLFACYTTFTNTMRNEVKGITLFLADILDGNGDIQSMTNTAGTYSEMRITIISQDGSVVFDNNTNTAELENHSNRPEIKSAKENGSGEELRFSSTLNALVYYYAVSLDNGYIIRVASPIHKIWSTLISVGIPLLAVAFLLYLLSVTISVRLTDNIIKPIEKAYYFDRENYDDVYEEIQPFLKRIAKQNKQLRQYIKDLKRAEQLRREFSANVSHELRTPLTTIKGYSQLIRTGIAKPEDICEFAEKIENETSRLIVLISDIMKLSKLDEKAGAIKTRVNLRTAAQSAAMRLREQALKKNVTITIIGDNEFVWSDESQTEELLYNLIDNAIKYNRDGGSVTITAKDNTVVVEDTGIGIPPEYTERIFERFFRVDKSRSQKISGTGLGLSIVKHIAITNGIKLSVQSKVDEGTAFTVTFEKCT